MTEHTVKAFGEELDQLTAEVVRMGGLCEAQVLEAVDSVVRRDVGLAQQVIQRDAKLDELQREIERKALRLIALRQPMAADLRHTVAALKISLSLERTGDMAKSIAKRGLILSQAEPMTTLTKSLGRMGKLVAGRLKDVLDAYASSDVEAAMSVWARDAEIDEHYESLFRELLTYMMGDPRTITSSAHLLFMAKNLERIGDHATNLAEIIKYEITGEEVTDARPKGEGEA